MYYVIISNSHFDLATLHFATSSQLSRSCFIWI